MEKGDSNGDKSSEGASAKRPEFVVLEGEVEDYDPREEKYMHSFKVLEQHHFTPGIRLLVFFGSFCVLLWSLIAFLRLLISLAFSIATFFQSPDIVQNLRAAWSSVKSSLVVALGCFLAAFNPTFGFGIILFYFMLGGQPIEKTIMGRFFDTR